MYPRKILPGTQFGTGGCSRDKVTSRHKIGSLVFQVCRTSVCQSSKQFHLHGWGGESQLNILPLIAKSLSSKYRIRSEQTVERHLIQFDMQCSCIHERVGAFHLSWLLTIACCKQLGKWEMARLASMNLQAPPGRRPHHFSQEHEASAFYASAAAFVA